MAVEIQSRPFEPGDIDGAILVIAATNQAEVNSAVISESRKRGILCNDAATSECGDFVVPSTAHRGEFILAVTTSGASPAFSKRVRDQLLVQFGPEYGEFVGLLRELRADVLHNVSDAAQRHEILSKAAEDDFAIQLIRDGQIQEARDRLFKCISTSPV